MATKHSSTPAPQHPELKLSYPDGDQHILLITINRPKQMNSIHHELHWRMYELLQWFDAEPNLRVAIITGAGDKAFCAGQDLIELGMSQGKKIEPWLKQHPPGGFAGISRRLGKKPIIAAVNGYALGGGMEITLNWYVCSAAHLL